MKSIVFMIICYRHFSKEGAVHSAPLLLFVLFFKAQIIKLSLKKKNLIL